VLRSPRFLERPSGHMRGWRASKNQGRTTFSHAPAAHSSLGGIRDTSLVRTCSDSAHFWKVDLRHVQDPSSGVSASWRLFYVQGRPFVGPRKIREALQGLFVLALLQISARVWSHHVRGGVLIFREERPDLAMLRPSQVEKIAQNRLEAPYRMEFCSPSSTNWPGDATNALHVVCQISR